jgi:hypothetical protein
MTDPQENPNHSDVNTTLAIDVDETAMESKEAVFISDSNNRMFRIKTAGLYFMIHAIFIFWTFYYLHDTQGKHKNLKQWFRNYDWVGNGYDIAFTSILLVSLGVVSFWPKLARSAAGYGLTGVILMSYAYLIGFILRIGCKSTIDLDEELCKIFIGFWCSGVGLLVAACLPGEKFNKTIGLAIGVPLYIVMLILWRFVYKMDNPQYIVTLGYIAGTSVYAWYINECLNIMVTKRQHKYMTSDMVLPFANLQTDIFLLFWIDLFRKKPKTDFEMKEEISEEEENVEQKEE